MLAAVKQDGLALEFAWDELKGDKEVVLAAVAQAGDALEHASDELKDDKEVVLAAVKQDGLALWDASAQLKSDKDVILAAVSQNWRALEIVVPNPTHDLIKDEEIARLAMSKNNGADIYIDPATLDSIIDQAKVAMAFKRGFPGETGNKEDTLKYALRHHFNKDDEGAGVRKRPVRSATARRISKKRISKNCMSKKRISKNCMSKKRISKKRISKKRISKKRISKKSIKIKRK